MSNYCLLFLNHTSKPSKTWSFASTSHYFYTAAICFKWNLVKVSLIYTCLECFLAIAVPVLSLRVSLWPEWLPSFMSECQLSTESWPQGAVLRELDKSVVFCSNWWALVIIKTHFNFFCGQVFLVMHNQKMHASSGASKSGSSPKNINKICWPASNILEHRQAMVCSLARKQELV